MIIKMLYKHLCDICGRINTVRILTVRNKNNTLEISNSRLDNTEQWISDLENRVVEIT